MSFFHAPGLSFREASQTNNPPFDSTEENPFDKARRERRRALILPREHGAWGLLLVPMVTGAGVAFHQASHIFPLILLLTAALALFWLRTPFENLLGTSAMRAQTLEESHTLRAIIVLLAGIAAVTLGALLWAGRNAGLWPLGAAVAFAFIAQAVLKKVGRRARMLSEMVGTIGLTASAPAAYYVITGELNATAWMLWLANVLFAGDQIHYVQLRIHTAKIQGFRAKFANGWVFALGQALMTAIITLACLARLMPPIASLAFAPLLFRGWFYFVQEPTPLVVRRLGWGELKHATVFCVLLIATFVLARPR
ncbi:MAG TPA: YwiC-like family protein [Candidatus Sulfotelmatobacter sp.]|nr:YwiC-like family protein [Candidatus Sulfotelmatobacter sp.]